MNGMRRGCSILMIALLWLAPFLALLPGSDDARLPACCRRHGAHHCAMDAATPAVAVTTATTQILQSPRHCSSFPASVPASGSVFALPPSALPSLSAPSLLRQSRVTAEALHFAVLHAGRGPPSMA